MNERVTGLGLVGIVCASQVLSALTSRVAVQSLNAPFFLMWIHTLMMVFLWPLGLVVETMPMIGGCCNKTNNNNGQQQHNNSCCCSCGDRDDHTRRERVALLVRDARRKIPRMLFLIVLLFYPLWIAANYCYVAALRHVPASTMVSIFGSCTAFVSVEEAIWLRNKPCTIVRTVAVLLAFGGVVAYGVLSSSHNGTSVVDVDGSNERQSIENRETVVVGRENENNNTLLIGVFLGTCSSLAAATYKVAFKKFLGSPTRIDVCLFLSVLGTVNGVMGVVPTLALAHSGAEQPFYHSELTTSSWVIIWCGSVFILVFNASIAFGIAATSPLFMAVGTVLTIPVTVAIDYFCIIDDPGSNALIGTGQVTASAAIVASFVVIIVFDQHLVESDGGSIAGTANIVRNRTTNKEPNEEAGILLDSRSEFNPGGGGDGEGDGDLEEEHAC
jgi:drug/metabolite transporter (DMT)-like permease